MTGLQWPQNQEGTRCTESPFLGFRCEGSGPGLAEQGTCCAQLGSGDDALAEFLGWIVSSVPSA